MVYVYERSCEVNDVDSGGTMRTSVFHGMFFCPCACACMREGTTTAFEIGDEIPLIWIFPFHRDETDS